MPAPTNLEVPPYSYETDTVIVIGVDQETGKESFAFSKKDVEERKKLSEKLAKLDKAIDAAIAEPSPESYSKLAQAVEKASK